LEKAKSKLNKAGILQLLEQEFISTGQTLLVIKIAYSALVSFLALLWLKRLKVIISHRNIAGYNWALVLNPLLVGGFPSMPKPS
jgi:hypothetical protein